MIAKTIYNLESPPERSPRKLGVECGRGVLHVAWWTCQAPPPEIAVAGTPGSDGLGGPGSRKMHQEAEEFTDDPWNFSLLR